MLRKCACATLVLMLAGVAYGADATDSLTGLPLPDAVAGVKLFKPMQLDPAQVCKSTQVTNFYSPSGFKTSAAIAWYAAHLKGFQHLHGYGAGRTQDAFVNADGTLDVVVTGSPGPDGADSAVYAISYATLKPGLSQKTMQGMLSHKINC